METLSLHLSRSLGKIAPVYLIAWGGSQRFLGAFLAGAVLGMVRLRRSGTRPSIVYFGDALTALLAPIARRIFPDVPIVVTVHGLDVTYGLPLYQPVISAVLRRADHVVGVSRRARRECCDRGVREERTSVIRSGVPATRSARINLDERQAARKRLTYRIPSLTMGRSIFLTVGRLRERKGVEWFVREVVPRLVAERDDVLYLVAGDGPMREAIVEGAKSRDVSDRVILLGQVDDATRDDLYRAADIFVMPNIPVKGDVEGYGLVALEAAARGLWVVAAGIDGIVDAVTSESGELLPPRCADQWVGRLLELVRDPAESLRLGQQAQRHISSELTWPLVAARYLDLFRRVSKR